MKTTCGVLCSKLGLAKGATLKTFRSSKRGPIVDAEALAELVLSAGAEACRAHGCTVEHTKEDNILVIWADVPAGATGSSASGSSRGASQQRGAGSSSATAASSSAAASDGSSLSTRAVSSQLTCYMARVVESKFVFKQHNPETGVVEEKAVSSRDELPAEGTPGVEVDWDHSRAKGQLLAETFAAEDELWVDCNKCCVQVACKLDPSKNSDKWDFDLRRQVTAMPCWCGYVAQGIGSGIGIVSD